MADLVTHMATGLLFKAGTGGQHTGALVLGTVLPAISSFFPRNRRQNGHFSRCILVVLCVMASAN